MTFILQGNPKYFDIDSYISEHQFIYWTASRLSKEMKIGDAVYIWRSGANAGAIAKGVISELPKTIEQLKGNTELREDLWIDDSEVSSTLKVGVTISEVRLTAEDGMVSRIVIKDDEGLSKSSIITAPQGTVFKLKEAEVNSLDGLWEQDKKKNSKWSEEELKASVLAYVDMRNKELNRIGFSKKSYYENLSKQFDRTAKSFEFRMQNISYVYSLLGRTWIKGLKPAKNVGSKNASIIERLIAEAEGEEFLNIADFESDVLSRRNKPNLAPPAGVKKATKSTSTITVRERDSKVKAWVLNASKGVCESCNVKAPFVTDNKLPFLEVHHLKRLCDDGTDTVTNAVAICPNCHRELHYGIDRGKKLDKIYNEVKRLIRE